MENIEQTSAAAFKTWKLGPNILIKCKTVSFKLLNKFGKLSNSNYVIHTNVNICMYNYTLNKEIVYYFLLL